MVKSAQKKKKSVVENFLIPKNKFRHLLSEGSTLSETRFKAETYPVLRNLIEEQVKQYTKELMRKLELILVHGKRKTVSAEDIEFLQRHQ